jgi:BMFP domain-containing protein YqiC
MDDMMALSGNVLGNLLGARHEVKAQAKQHMRGIAKQLNLVSREEFDAAFAMLAKARAMQEDLAMRLDALESQLVVSRQTGIKRKTKRRLPSFKKSNTRGRRG